MLYDVRAFQKSLLRYAGGIFGARQTDSKGNFPFMVSNAAALVQKNGHSCKTLIFALYESFYKRGVIYTPYLFRTHTAAFWTTYKALWEPVIYPCRVSVSDRQQQHQQEPMKECAMWSHSSMPLYAVIQCRRIDYTGHLSDREYNYIPLQK